MTRSSTSPVTASRSRASTCAGGRVVCLIDPVGDVYACPFAIDDQFRAGNVRASGGFTSVWRDSALFTSLRQPSSGGACQQCSAYDWCRGGCMAAKYFTGLPLDGPDPECVNGHGERLVAADRHVPRSSVACPTCRCVWSATCTRSPPTVVGSRFEPTTRESSDRSVSKLPDACRAAFQSRVQLRK